MSVCSRPGLTRLFAVKAVLEPSDVVALRRDLMDALDPAGDLATSGELRVQRTFMEHSQALLRLLANERFIAINEALHGTDQLTLHRNGAIAKGAGSGTMSWHTDFRSASPNPDTVDAILNTGDWPNGVWFYLNGSHPSRGGLAVCADSHREDWQCPRDFVRTDRSLAPSESVAEAAAAAGEPELAPFRIDGCVPIISDPEDLVRESYFFRFTTFRSLANPKAPPSQIIFAARTFHAAFPYHLREPRLSVSCCFRTGRERLPTLPEDWRLGESAKRLIETAPEFARPYIENYTSIDGTWKPASNV